MLSWWSSYKKLKRVCALFAIVSEATFGVMVNSSFPPVNYAIQDVNCSNTYYLYSIGACDYNVADSSVCGVGGSSIAGAICRQGEFV